MRFLLKSVIVACITFTILLTMLYFVPGLALLPVAAKVSASRYCSLWQGVADAKVKVAQYEEAKRIAAKSKLLRTDGEFRLWETPGGTYWVPGDSMEILPILLAQQKRKIYGGASTGGVRPGDVVLDCGAHIGTYAKAALAAGAAKIIAIEPSPQAIEAFRRNLAAEMRTGTVILVEKGVWDKEEILQFFENGNGAAGDGFLVRGEGAKVVASIPVTTIDRIVADLKLPRVDLIKADVKGAGERMIQGAAGTIRKHHPRIVISTEEPPEEPEAIRTAVLRQDPAYKFRCGPCIMSGTDLRTDVVFFQRD